MMLARAHVNDSQPGLTDSPGEGQILTDDPIVSPFTLPFLNSAIRTLHRDLELSGSPMIIRDNVVVTGLTPVHGAQGLGVQDPAVQVNLSFVGFDDGTNVSTLIVLPNDVLSIERVWERMSSTNDQFQSVHEAQSGLPSQLQGNVFGLWEYRGDALWFPGAITTRDIRLRYYAALPIVDPNSDFTQTSITILDSTDCLALMVAAMYSAARGGLGAGTLEAKAATEIQKTKNRAVRRSQTVTYQRPPFGSHRA
jgi:hypothetical protein